MKNVTTNQNGYALILVLLTIALIGIFIPIIITNIFNNSLQFQKIEENNQLLKLEEMAYLYMDKALDHSAKVAQEKIVIWFEDNPGADSTLILNTFLDIFEDELSFYEVALGSELHKKMHDSSEGFAYNIDIYEISGTNESIRIKFRVNSTTSDDYTSNPIETERTITLSIEE
ncbi:hypothetical protein JCM9140_3464 [Halalkalibacter wakoensis JCM 9140]|uniref:Uncharacterized protein n=1 Tax=Halalkalibacter wakoensis JCM 9140 TaxID=1236970 RepID=W4Q5T7_9BACI|nr:hypothetical protein [Halalkalibacter wakoensis]GAE27330.1 hypothetical protein JCM9140_3464 [Halalkalibacter wakoensis JCM 9140]